MPSKRARKPQRRRTERPHSRRFTSVRAVQAAGIATTAIAGALVMVVTAPQATADPSSSSQPVIDQILADMQQAVAHDSALPFATPDSDAMLPTTLQNTNYELLMSLLSADTAGVNGVFFQSPEAVAGDAADPRQFFQFFTPDIYYRVVDRLDPNATYDLTGTVGRGTEGLSISLEQISSAGASTGSSLEFGSNLVVNPDGTFTVDIGPTEPSGAVNYIEDANGAGLLIRDDLGDWALGPGSLGIQCVADCPAANPNITDTGLSSPGISLLLNQLSAEVTPFNSLDMSLTTAAGSLLPANTMSPLENETGFGAGLTSAVVSSGNFDLQHGQALIVQVPDVPSAYSGIELMNNFGAALPYTLAQTTLNNTQAFADPDGYTDYVISATNPGVANWLDSSGVTSGDIFARFENIPAGTSATGQGVTTQVVPVADVRDYLPADTPTVSPEQYAAAMTERVLSYDYALDTSRESAQPDWVTQELWLNDLQTAMGTDNFDAVFGTEPATPLWLRETPALSPEWGTVAKDILTNPTGSLTAIQDNLALAENDISLPTTLAETLLQQDFTQTSEAVQSAISSDNLTGVLQALETGGQQLGSISNEALFDPNTSITAGILNARDDLATAVETANGGFSSQSDLLSTLEWDVMPQLTQLSDATTSAEFGSDLGSLLSAVGSDLSTLLNPADLATLF